MVDTTSISSAQGPQIQAALVRASVRTGVDFGYLFNQARIESDLNPLARASTSSAAGLFQFTEQTWLQMVKAHGADHGLEWAAGAVVKDRAGRLAVPDPTARDAILRLRFDPEIASAMAGELAADNRDHMEQSLGRTAEPVDLYLAHFLGAGAALKFLRAHEADPSQPAAALFPAAAAANRPIFYGNDGTPRSLADIRGHFAARLGEALPSYTLQFASTRVNTADQMEARLKMGQIEAMPGRLSLGFAQAAYQRLSQMGAGA